MEIYIFLYLVLLCSRVVIIINRGWVGIHVGLNLSVFFPLYVDLHTLLSLSRQSHCLTLSLSLSLSLSRQSHCLHADSFPTLWVPLSNAVSVSPFVFVTPPPPPLCFLNSSIASNWSDFVIWWVHVNCSLGLIGWTVGLCSEVRTGSPKRYHCGRVAPLY